MAGAAGSRGRPSEPEAKVQAVSQPMTSTRRRAFARPRATAFTLVELLIVMAIIILILVVAIPAYNAITGSRSIESAENQVSSFLGVVRSDALSLQEPRGAVFFEDPGTRRITMVEVFIQPKAAASTANILALVNGRDEAVLPNGVGLQCVPTDTNPANSQDPTPPLSNGPQRYRWRQFGVVLFDGNGRLLIQDYRLPATSTTGDLGKRLAGALHQATDPTVTIPMPFNGISTIGIALFDGGTYGSLPADAQPAWLEQNAVPYLINRYSGSLLRGQ